MDEKEYAEKLIDVGTALYTTPKNCYCSGIEGIRILMSDAKLLVDTAIKLAAERAAKSK
jgi:hypothetical protein